VTYDETLRALDHFRGQQKAAADAAEAAGDLATAARCRARAKAAKEGRFLHEEQEMRDPAFAMGHQKLIGAAATHGLIEPAPTTKPPAAGSDYAPGGRYAR
jgi:hypothetical protein